MVVVRESNEQGDEGAQITIGLSELEAASLGHDAQLMAEILDSAIWALGMLRTGVNSRDHGTPPPSLGDWHACLRGLERLGPRIDGVRHGAVRAYLAAGGTTERLAAALNVDEETATDIAAKVSAEAPGVWESWAAAAPFGGGRR